MTIAKIRIKIGSIEIDYEGDSDFLDRDLLKMVQELQKVSPPDLASNHQGGSSGGGGTPLQSGHTLTTKSIATKLGAKSGSELGQAAVAHLALIKGQGTFKRSEINDAMKSAAGIYKTNMTGNLSPIIQKLLNDDTIVETGADTYAITPNAEALFKGKLGIG
jgi:hypothetical protein